MKYDEMMRYAKKADEINALVKNISDKYRDGAIEHECAYERIPEKDRGKPMMLYCVCPRCSPSC